MDDFANHKSSFCYSFNNVLYSFTSSQEPPSSDRDEDDSRYGDSNRSRRYTERRTGECGENKQCEDICDDIFRSRNAREDCEAFSISAVEDMEDVFKVLEEPDTNDLEAMDLEVLKDLLDISSEPLKKAISDMSTNGRREFLVWFAKDSEAAEIIIEVEDESDIREALFPRFIVSPSSRSDLNQSIGGGKTFVEVALESDNEPVLEWLHYSFEETAWCKWHKDFTFTVSGEERDGYPICLFDNFYCALHLDADLEDEYFKYEFFTDLLDEVLVVGRKRGNFPPSWWTTGIEADDLDTWLPPMMFAVICMLGMRLAPDSK